jgi:DNA primase
MSVNDKTGSFKCWVCDAVYGDVIKLVMLIKRCTFVDALEWLNSRTPVHSIAADFNTGPVSQKTHSRIHFEMDMEYRNRIILDFLKLLKPVDGPVLKYLVSRKIFRNTADAQKVRMIDNYDRVNRALKKLYPLKDLQEYGFYSDTRHLRFYKHPLIFPYLNHEGLPVYFQARAVEQGVTPKELNIKGVIPLPYNAPLLDKKPGIVFLCEGVIDTLTMITKNFPTVGVPGVNSFKSEWFELFKNKNVIIAFDGDEAGKKASDKLHSSFIERGIASSIITLPDGEDVNEWFNT